MNIEVIEIEEQPDGTARLTLDIDNEVVQMLLEHAVKDILTKYIEENDGPK